MSEQTELSREVEEGRENKILPNGDYTGSLYIIAGVVGVENSPDYGRMKLIFEFTVTEGEHKNELVFANRVISPGYLANEPPRSDIAARAKWYAALNRHAEQTNRLLGKCGVEVSNTDGTLLMQSVAESNVRRAVVNFTVTNGVPQINRFVKFENNEKMPDEDFSLPDGNDLPL